MVIFSLISFHITNINGIAEFDTNNINNTIINNTISNNTISNNTNNNTTNTTEVDDRIKEKKMNYLKLGIGKYKYQYIEYWIGHIFFIIIMFLINSIHTDELKPIDRGSVKNIGIKRRDQLNEENIKDEEDKNKDEESKDEEKLDENNEEEKREIIFDTKYSINDNRDNSIFKNKEENEKKKEIEK